MVALVVMILSFPAWGGIKITGLITDENNKPLEFATIKIQGTALGTTSGLDGTYTLTAPEADTIRVVYSCLGYETSKRRLIDQKPGSKVTINVKLTPVSYDLGPIEVTEVAKQTSSVQKLNIDSYKLAPTVGAGGVESLLTTLAGVNSNNELSSQYSVRGGAYDENSVYINGVEIYRPQLVSSGQQEGLSVINPDLTGAVGFSSGGFSAQYGDRMSSVLDITYREPSAFEASVGLSLLGANAAVGSSSKRFTQLHGVRYKSNSSILGGLEEKGEYQPRYFDYQTSMGYRIGEKWKVSILGNISLNRYKFVPASRTTNFGTVNDAKQFKVYFDGSENDRFDTYFGAATLNFKASKRQEFSFMASAYMTDELVTYDISGEYWLDQAGTNGEGSGSNVGGELGVGRYLEHARNRLKAFVTDYSLRGSTRLLNHNFTYGISMKHEKLRDRSREWEMRDSAGYSLPNKPGVLKVIYNLTSHQDINTDRFSAFIQDALRFTTSAGYLNLNAGVRASYWSFNKEFLFSPRASIGFVPDKAPTWSFRFATGLYYQSPFYKEYRLQQVDAEGNITIIPNKDIKSQRSVHFILGSDFTFRAMNRPFKFSAEAYYKLLGNLIPYEIDNLKLVYAGQNLSKGYAMGLDTKIFGQFVPGSDSWLSFSLMKTQEDLNGKKVPRPTDQRYSVALYFTDYFPKLPMLKFSLRAIFSDGLPFISPRSSRDKGYFRSPPYKRVDVGFAYGLLTPRANGERRPGWLGAFKSVWLGFDVFNLFDISNVSSYYWVTDVNNIQYAVPNYLTRRQFNVKLNIEF